jgi:hypothetical protein
MTMARDIPEYGDFLSSHRAQAAGTREFSRLSSALVDAMRQIASSRGEGAPDVRMAPDRCIVQIGPLAVTVTHLRNAADRQAGGQLLAILWQGQIAQRGDHIPERLGARRVPPPPVSVWEESFDAAADSEADWRWSPTASAAQRFTSGEVASRCEHVVRAALRLLTEGSPDAVPTT